MKRFEAIQLILDSLQNDDIALFATGMISREAFGLHDRAQNYYLLGSMGLVSSVGLGIALNTDRSVFIFDGDGSALMDMGAMALIAAEAPANLSHIVLDNEMYQSTGNQPAISAKVDLAEVARAAGYRKSDCVEDIDGLKNWLKAVDKCAGPSFLLIKVEPGGLNHIPRVSHSPEYMTRKLREILV